MALISSSSSSNPMGYDDRQITTNKLQKKVMTLPRIEHPSKLINDDDRSSLDIRGRSANGSGDGQLIRSETSTPDLTYRRRRRSSSLRSSSYTIRESQQPLTEIPENVNAVYGEDRSQVRLPIFGRRPTSTTSSYGIESGKATPMTTRIVIDELEMVLREKVRSQLHDVRTKFRHSSDLDSNGKISRDSLKHLIASIFGTQRQIGPAQMDKLLERLDLRNSNKISFDEFLNSLFTGDEQLPGWVSRQSSSSAQEFIIKRTAAQMFLILKDKVRMKNKDLVDLCPSLDGGEPNRIFKAQFHNKLKEMGYRMKDKEFDKLWDKFDTDGFHAISSEKFLKRLTNEEIIKETVSVPTSESQDQQAAILKVQHPKSSRNDSAVKTPRLHSSASQLDENQIHTWLQHKFPNGFSELERSLERLDPKQTGTLPRDRFIDELKRFGLTFEGNLFDFFLKRLNIDLQSSNGSIPYRDVLNAFKHRTDSTRKRTNSDYISNEDESNQTALERQIEYLVSSNYDRIQEEFQRLDNYKNGTINTNELRSLIEDLLEFPLRPDEFYQLIKKFPTDENGKIKYKEYLKQIKERNSSKKQQQSEETPQIIPQWDYMISKNIRETLDQQHILHKKREKPNEPNETDMKKPRSIEQLREILKTIIRNRYKDIEDEFKRIDRGSYGELTQDLLYDLFKRLAIRPEITRSEIVLLWSRCHLKENGHLDFYQFLREFGYSKRSAHYPNAKQNPPKRGDADFLLTSRKLYGDSVLVHGAALNAIRSNWEELRYEFTRLDPYRTGYVQSEEFDDILTDLCPAVNQEDLDMLKFRFQTQNDERMNYVRFLKHHAPIADLVEEVEQTQPSSYSTTNKNTNVPTTLINSVQEKLRRKVNLSDSIKQLRRSFKQHDVTNSGSVPVRIFKQILIDLKCSLNDEEFYLLTSQIDTKMNGTINYNYFIQNYLRNT